MNLAQVLAQHSVNNADEAAMKQISYDERVAFYGDMGVVELLTEFKDREMTMTMKQKLDEIADITTNPSLDMDNKLQAIALVLHSETEVDTGINEQLKQVFLDDCVETHELTDEQALVAWAEHGDDFIDTQINLLWDNWSDDFPNVEVE